MIEVHQLNKRYGLRQAVKDLSFFVGPGEIVGFLGPNGAGKTTTMRIITGAMTASSGTVKIDGQDISEDPLGTKGKIGYLPEIPPLYGDMYVKSYLRYVAHLKKYPRSKIKRRVEEVVKKTGLQDVKNRWIQNLSKGFKQRLGLAQAMMSEPKILVLDEPTVGLDPAQVIQMRSLISHLRGQHTVILSTHILSEVQAICDRVIIIKEGRIVTQESLKSLKEKQMKAARRITLKVKKPSEALKQALTEVNGVVQVKQDGEKEVYTVFIRADQDSELNEKVAKLVIEGAYGFISLEESFNLEDVFLSLTEKNFKNPSQGDDNQ